MSHSLRNTALFLVAAVTGHLLAGEAAAQGTCASAIDQSGQALPFGVIVDNSATTNATKVSCADENGAKDAWIRLPELTSGTEYRIDASAAGGSAVSGARLEVFRGSCDALQSVACSDFQPGSLFSTVQFVAPAAGTYYVLTESPGASQGGAWQVTLSEAEAGEDAGICGLAKDESESSLPLHVVIDPTAGDSLRGASCAGDLGGTDNWIRLPVLNPAYVYTIDTGAERGGPDVDTRMELYAGTDCATAVPVACNDNAAPGNPLSHIEFIPESVTTSYWVFVESASPTETALYSVIMDAGTVLPTAATCDLAEDLTANMLPTVVSVDLSEGISLTKPSCAPEGSAPERWFRLPQLSQRAVYTIETQQAPGGPAVDTRLEVFSGECGRLTGIVCNDDITPGANKLSRVQFRGDAQKTFWVLAESGALGGGNVFNLSISDGVVTDPPTNETCATAQDISTVVFPLVDSKDVQGATDDGLYVPSGSPTGGVDVVYTLTPRTSGRYSLGASFSGEGNAVALGLWTGSCGALTPVCGGPVAEASPAISAYLTSGTTYIITIDDPDPSTLPTEYSLLVDGPDTSGGTSNNACASAMVVSSLPFSVTQDPTGNPGSLNLGAALGGQSCLGSLYYSIPSAAGERVLEVSALLASDQEGAPAVFALYTGGCASPVQLGATGVGKGRYVLSAGVPCFLVVEPFSLEAMGPTEVKIAAVPRPGGDLCPSATVLLSVPYSTTIDLTSARDEGVEAACSPVTTAGARRDVFFRFTPSSTGNYRIDAGTPGEAGTSPDVTLAVYTGACGSLVPVACENRTFAGEFLTATLNAGTPYTIQVEGEGVNDLNIIDPLPFSLKAVPASSANGDCLSARLLTDLDLPYEGSFNTAGNPARSALSFTGPTLVYKLSSARKGRVLVTATPGAGVDVAISALSNPNENPCDFRWAGFYGGEEVNSLANAGGNGGEEQLEFVIRRNEPALLFIEGVSPDGGSVSVSITFVEMAENSSWVTQ